MKRRHRVAIFGCGFGAVFAARRAGLCAGLAGVLLALTASAARAQVDPEPRKIIHLGVNQSLHDDGPLGAYAFYYWNMPNVPTTNQTLRLVIAPVYLDGELAFKGLLGKHTDVGLGINGGLYAYSYYDVSNGDYRREQSFDGDGGGGSASVYHLFNPASRVPLTGVLRGSVSYRSYSHTSDTDNAFEVPEDQPFVTLRTGLRWGGMEPTLGPTLGMEVSGWYELEHRTSSRDYGFANEIELAPTVHRFLGRAQIHYTTPHSRHFIVAGLSGGALVNSDRLSAFRIGGVLPYSSEFPLFLPGYFNGELEAENFGLLFGVYTLPVGESRRWSLIGMSALAAVDYIGGQGQSGAFNSGVGAGVGYTSRNKRWKVLALFGYGIEAERDDGRGGSTAALAFQYNFGDVTTATERAFEQLQNAHSVTR